MKQILLFVLALVFQGTFGFQVLRTLALQQRMQTTKNQGNENSTTRTLVSLCSVDNSTDNNSCIPTAHGLICPETIATIEKSANSNPMVQKFVDTYHRFGPLACVDMLSDQEILPHLTKALRDID